MLHRIEGGLDDIRSALELFGYIMECAIEAVDDRNPRSYIALSTAEEFGPWFMDGLLEAVDEGARRTLRYTAYQSFLGETLQPLKPLLDNLALMVHREGWPRDDFALGRFLLVVDYFKGIVEEPGLPNGPSAV